MPPFDSQDKYGEAEQLCRRSIAIKEQTLGIYHPDVAASLGSLTSMLQKQVAVAEETCLSFVRLIWLYTNSIGLVVLSPYTLIGRSLVNRILCRER